MAKLDLDWIGVFVEVYRARNVSRAAERLGIAQATASIVLGKLRTHFGDRLFARTPRGMEPTPRAQALYPELAAILARLDALRVEGTAFEPTTARRRFRVAMTDISEAVLLPGLLAHLRRDAPGVAIDTEPSDEATARRLESADVDLVIGFMPQLEAGFHEQTLFVQDFVCLAAAGHPRLQGRLTRRALEAEVHVLVPLPGTGHAMVDRALGRHGIERQVALRVRTFLGAARIVAETDLLAIVPRRLSEALSDQQRVRAFELPVALPGYAVKQHWHERMHGDPGHAWLRRTLARLFAASAAGARPGARGRGPARPSDGITSRAAS
jgi:DNA-binding transcriptional LysR family regulator